MTPAKHEELDYISGEIGSPILGLTARDSFQNKSFSSSTPTRTRFCPATPESKKSVRNILDQLCSPISTKGNEGSNFLSPDDKIENNIASTSSNESCTSETPKYFSKHRNKSKNKANINKSSQVDVNLNVNNELFDSISDASLQFLCEATNHLVETRSSCDENIQNDHKTLNEDSLNSSIRKKNDNPFNNLQVQKYLKANDEIIESNNLISFGNSKLIYSDTNFSLNPSSSVHLNDLFSEVKCLEEAHITFKNEIMKRHEQAPFKTIKENSTKSIVPCKQKNTFQTFNDLASVQCELDTENTILNDSLGISDTQFCEAIEAVELMSNLDKTLISNINACDKTAQNFLEIEENQKHSSVDSCIRKTISAISAVSLGEYSATSTHFSHKDINSFEGLQNIVRPTTETCITDYNSKIKKCELNISNTKNRNISESQTNATLKESGAMKHLLEVTVCQTQHNHAFKIPIKPMKIANYSLSSKKQSSESNLSTDFQISEGIALPDNDNCELEPVLKGFQADNSKMLNTAKNIIDKSRNSVHKSDCENKLSDEPWEKETCLLTNTNIKPPNDHKKSEGTEWSNRRVFLDESCSEYDQVLEGFKIPNNAVNHCRNLRETKFCDHQSNLKSNGFQTASGKSVILSEESLEEAKRFLDDGPKPTKKGLHQSSNEKSGNTSEKPINQVDELFSDGPNLGAKGFQTANGKSIQISDESLKTAKQLFNDSTHITEKGFQTASGKSVNISKESLKKAKQSFDNDSNLKEIGFQTASGKTVKISEESFKKAKKLFDDGTNLTEKCFQTASGKSVQISDQSFEEPNQLIDNGPKIMGKGFQTASGKSVQISERSLKKARQLFDDSTDFSEKCFQTASGKSVQIADQSLVKFKQQFGGDANFTEIGLQTASGKTVKISKESLKEAQKFFDDGNNLTEKCFQTAGGKSIQVTDQSLEEANQLFDDGPKIMSKGFQTASGKSVQISEQSLKTARQLFDDSTYFSEKCFQTASRKSVQIADQSLVKVKQQFGGDANFTEKGFQTASGKTVKISKESLKEAHTFFDDGANIKEKCFQTAGGKSIIQVSDQSFEEVNQLFDDCPRIMSKGFQTASGKSVQISEQSLKKARQLFDDSANLSEKCFQAASIKSIEILDQSENSKLLLDNCPKLMGKGFQTASGKSVKISEESLKEARQLFDDGTNLMSKGFQTASGRSVVIPEDALKKAKQLFDDGSNLTEKCFQITTRKSIQISEKCLDKSKQLFGGGIKLTGGKGFQTASGKTVKISEESLKKAKQLLNDGTNVTEKCFQTASVKSVQVSEQSFEEVKQLFYNGPMLMGRGFQTASGKTVQISEESLERAKQLLVNDRNILIEKGFETTSGKVVSLLEEASRHAKQLFEDRPDLREKDLRKKSLNSIQNFKESETGTYNKIQITSHDVLLEGYQSAYRKSDEVARGCSKSPQNSSHGSNHKPDFKFNGFKTATGKSVKISEESLKIAKNMLEITSLESKLGPEAFDSIKEDSLIESFSTEAVLKGFHKVGGKCVKISENSPEKTWDKLDISCAEFKPQTFKTASGKGVDISEESLKKTKDLFKEDCVETGNNLVEFKFDYEVDKLGKSENLDQTEDSETLEAMKGLENVPQNGELTMQETEKLKRKQPSHCSYNRNSLNDSLSGRHERSNGNSLHNKRRKLFTENDTTNQVNEDKFVYDEQSSMIGGASVISEADLSLLNHSRTSLGENESKCSPEFMSPGVAREVSESMAALLADEATNSPFSLKPFLSSPGMLYDRQVRLPSISCYENEVDINNKQLSPILGSRCVMNQKKYSKHETCGVSTPTTLLNKTDNINTKSCSFKPPYATSTPNESQVPSKRKSLYSNLYPQTQKRQKTSSSENEMVCDISKGRLEAKVKQEKYITEKLKKHAEIKPCKGSYLLRKQTEKSRSLCDLTGNRPLCLPSVQQLNRYGVKKSVQEISIRNVTEFKFLAMDYFSTETASSNVNGIPVGDGALLILDGEGKAGVKEVTRAFLASPSIDPSLISNEWVENHFKWIVLKMAAMERMFPCEFGNRYLTPNNLMLQLKYRYDREIDRSQRPALRKILEKDESASKTMVLFVADILDVEVQPDKEKHLVRQELELSDGWYSVKATIDHEMEMLIRNRKVGIGTKLVITGAELSNNETGCSPLETPANVRLRVSTNSVRRARWFARLGFHATGPRPARLRDVLGRGGALSALTAKVARTYPMLFLEKVGGKTVIRSERAEQMAADEYQTKRQQCAETILSQLQRELESSRNKKHPVTRTSIKHATNTKHLYSLLDGVDDISFLQDTLSKEQMEEIKQLKEEEMRKAQQQLQDKLVDQLDKKLAPRNVTRMLKVRLVDEEEQTGRSALLTVWNPSDDVVNCLTEGNLLTFFNISASGFSRFGDLQLTAGKQTKFSLQKHCPNPRRITSLSDLQNSDYKPEFSEVDVVGLVVESADSSPDKTSNLIHLADSNLNFIGVSFWTDIKSAGHAAALLPGSLVAASNLHWRSHLVSWRLPTAFATETSAFSRHPRQPHLQQALAVLRRQVRSMDLDKYLQSCQDRIKTLIAQRNCGGVQKVSTPAGESTASVGTCGSRANRGNSDQKLARDKVDSSITENIHTPINRRLEMLEIYGEPPPISPLSTSTPTSVKRSFRPPTRKLCDKR